MSRDDSASHDMAYAARFPGMPGYGAIAVDFADKETAKFVADCIRRGAHVERVTVKAASDGMGIYLAARQARTAGVKTPDGEQHG
jgi:hypothetical protein